jgi:hypothetical protein
VSPHTCTTTSRISGSALDDAETMFVHIDRATRAGRSLSAPVWLAFSNGHDLRDTVVKSVDDMGWRRTISSASQLRGYRSTH